MVKASTLPIDTGASATAMAQKIFGDGVTVVSSSYSGSSYSSGIYSNGDAVSGGVTPSDTGVILSTGQAPCFPNWHTYDAAWLDVDFIPTGDMMTMQVVFSSDEYPEYANTVYNDAVGVWVNGQPAMLSVGTGRKDVGNVNAVDRFNLYQDNAGDAFHTKMDGFTITMTLTMPVIAGQVNSIRIGIADVTDCNNDANLLIARGSVQTTLIAHSDEMRVDAGGSEAIDLLGTDYSAFGAQLVVTHLNGVAVSAGDRVTLPNGQMVTLNRDGTVTIVPDSNDTDAGFVTANTLPCFVAGTLIRTPDGEKPVETLAPGDLVLTQDNGAQELRWTGQRRVAAEGDLAPIRIAAHSFGVHRTLLVSPQHRVVIRDALSELLFGEPEVLVAAGHLVNDRTVTRQTGGHVDYVHLMFDDHQVIYSEGLATESFLPSPEMAEGFDSDVLKEIVAIFPELDPSTGVGYGPTARRTLKEFEAKVLMQGARAA